MLLWFAGPSGAVFVSDGPPGAQGISPEAGGALKRRNTQQQPSCFSEKTRMKGEEEVFVFISCVRICMYVHALSRLFLTAELNVCRMYSIRTHWLLSCCCRGAFLRSVCIH